MDKITDHITEDFVVVHQPQHLEVPLLQNISRKRNLSIEEVTRMLQYNIITVHQLSKLAGVSTSGIEFKTRPRVVAGTLKTDFKTAYPFSANSDHRGPRFVIINDAVMSFLKKANK